MQIEKYNIDDIKTARQKRITDNRANCILLNQIESNQISREAVRALLEEKIEQISAANLDGFAEALMCGQVALQVQRTLEEGREVSAEDLEQGLNRLMNSELMNRLKPLFTPNLVKNIGDFPYSVIDRDNFFRRFSLAIDCVSQVPFILGYSFIYIYYFAPQSLPSYGVAVDNHLVRTSIMLLIALAAHGHMLAKEIKELKTGMSCNYYDAVVSEMEKFSDRVIIADAAALLPKLERLAKFLNDQDESLQKMKQNDFSAEVLNCLETYEDVDSFISHRKLPDNPEILQDNPYRGAVLRQTQMTTERACACLKIGTDVLKKGHKNRKRKAKRLSTEHSSIEVSHKEKIRVANPTSVAVRISEEVNLGVRVNSDNIVEEEYAVPSIPGEMAPQKMSG